MKRENFENYLNCLFLIKNIELKLEDAMDDSYLYIIDELSKFIIKNNDYSSKDTFVKLADTVVDFIEKYNNSVINTTNIVNYYNDLKKSVRDFKRELEDEWQLNIYFYGKDQYGLIDNKLNIHPIKRIVNQKQLNILALQKNNKCNVYNILFISENLRLKNNYFDEILNYNQIALSIKTGSQSLYKKDYQYHFIKSALNKAMYDKSITNIIIGNSYPLVGVDKEMIRKDTVNLSVSSQDLYYSIELFKKAISMNKNINTCILGISYFLLRQDLSMGQSEYSKNMIKYLYNPLLEDCHNSKEEHMLKISNLETLGVDILLKTIFDLEKVESYFGLKLYEKYNIFYNKDLNPRILTYKWSELKEDIKYKYSEYRAEQHNKLYQYENTKEEYTKLLNQFLEFLNENNVELKCVVFPTTKYYEKKISKEFKKEFAEIIKYLKEKNIKVIDLRLKNEYFTDEDFADADHLNDLGAIKATNFIKEEL